MDWDAYFAGFAEWAAKKSKDSTQVGAALVGPEGEVRLTGFNGPPRGVQDTPERRERPAKYLFASHAEANLIAFAAREGIRTEGCRVYTTHFCCSGCARTLIQAGVKGVFVGAGRTSMPDEEFAAAHQMFVEAGVEVHGACQSRQFGDTTKCAACRLVWDTNDADPPRCPLLADLRNPNR